MPDDARGIIPERELSRLAELYLRLEGAIDPISTATKEAQQEFDSLVEEIFTERVKPQFPSLLLFQFKSAVRNECRKRWAKHGPPFPCITPERKSKPPIVDDDCP